MLRRTLFHKFLSRLVREGSLAVETASRERRLYGDGTGMPIVIRIADQAAEWRLLLNPELAFGELYMDERVQVTRGSIYEALQLLVRSRASQGLPGWARLLTRLRTAARRLHQRNHEMRAKRNVAHHYDVDRRVYELFLDADWQYSCAYFEAPDKSLDEAQLAKKRHIAAKLLVEPGMSVLDIGSGWGGLALYLAERSGARVTGITLSEEQLAVARARAEASGLADRVAFALQDYRATPGRFDRIVSVGMFEHVGVGYYDTFFAQAARLLSDDGVMLLHTIGRSDGPGATNPWIAKYIFPGGYAPALSEVLPSIERAGLVVTDIEVLRLHYAETVRAWRSRFANRRDEARALHGERFCRMWEFYLAAAECSFRYDGHVVFQIQVTKRQDAVPLTRTYVDEDESSLREKEGAVRAPRQRLQA